jgi:hypothetical protein
MDTQLSHDDVQRWIATHFKFPFHEPQIVRCDNKLGVYTVALNQTLSHTFADPWIATLYLVWTDEEQLFSFRCIIKPNEVENQILRIIAFKEDGADFHIDFDDRHHLHGGQSRKCWACISTTDTGSRPIYTGQSGKHLQTT